MRQLHQSETPIANQSYQDGIPTGRLMFSEYWTEPSDEHLYNTIQSVNKPSSPASEGHAANQTYQDDKKKRATTDKRYRNRSAYVISHDSCICLILLGNNCFIDNNKNDV